MSSPPLDSTHGRQCQAWHDITALGQYTRSATSGMDVKSGITSSPLDNTHGHMMSGVTCHHCLWTAHTVGLGRQHRAWHDITALGQHTRSDYVGRGMTLAPLDSTHSQTTSGVACHHSPWMANTVKRRRARHAIIALRLADTVGRRRA